MRQAAGRFDMPDQFDALHKLLKKDRSAALEQLLDPASCSIREPYVEDLNHAWYVVGDIYFKQDDFTPALESFLKSLDDRPDDVEAMMAIANCASELGDPALSEKYLRAALKQSESAALFYNLGNVLFDQGKFGEALCYFKRVAVSDSEIYAMAQRNLERCHAMRRDR
jgi:tetratricopeptide (TPR) repeat protein